MPEYVALDLETTGLDPHHDRVIEVGAVAFTPDRVLDRLERLVDPRRSVPEAVLRLQIAASRTSDSGRSTSTSGTSPPPTIWSSAGFYFITCAIPSTSFGGCGPPCAQVG